LEVDPYRRSKFDADIRNASSIGSRRFIAEAMVGNPFVHLVGRVPELAICEEVSG
jgi:hypothetical protein